MKKDKTLCTFLRIDHTEKIIAILSSRAEASREWRETVDELRESVRRAREGQRARDIASGLARKKKAGKG